MPLHKAKTLERPLKLDKGIEDFFITDPDKAQRKLVFIQGYIWKKSSVRSKNSRLHCTLIENLKLPYPLDKLTHKLVLG